MTEVKLCPVCEGKTIVAPGFYEFAPNPTAAVPQPEPCRSCGGRGYLVIIT